MTELTAGDAIDVARHHFELDVEAQRLDGEFDVNFALRDASGARYTLKFSTRDTPSLRFQTALLAHLAERHPELGTPRPVDAVGKGPLVVDPRWPHVRIRVLTWITGRPYGELDEKDAKLRYEIGRYTGRLTHALAGFTHSAAPTTHRWDLGAAAELHPAAGYIEPAPTRNAVERVLERFRDDFAVPVRDLPQGVIHGDLNDANVLVDDTGTAVSGAIDFGDASFAPALFDLAIAAAYACLDTDEPACAITDVVDGFRSVHPLAPEEAELVRPLAETRLATSLAIAAQRRVEHPERRDWQRSASAVGAALQRLVGAR